VLKPPSGAASQATYRADGPDTLRLALDTMQANAANPVLLEEFITGDEHSFDSFSPDGQPVFHSLTRYLPQPLDVVRNPWIQWRGGLPREIDVPQYDGIRKVAFRALDALGMTTGISHLEWFRRPDDSIAVSEVAARPEVILFDEPCSALDPISTAKIEELIDELKEDYTITIVTHNMQQAGRCSDFTAFFYLGRLIEVDATSKIFSNPSQRQTEDYITGRFG